MRTVNERTARAARRRGACSSVCRTVSAVKSGIVVERLMAARVDADRNVGVTKSRRDTVRRRVEELSVVVNRVLVFPPVG